MTNAEMPHDRYFRAATKLSAGSCRKFAKRGA
jgi:hypothetical protein